MCGALTRAGQLQVVTSRTLCASPSERRQYHIDAQRARASASGRVVVVSGLMAWHAAVARVQEAVRARTWQALYHAEWSTTASAS